MRGYEDGEYEDYDDYEEDGYRQEEGGEEEDEYDEEEEEEEPKPTKEELEYLELRQKLKESIRKKMKKEASSSQEVKKDNFGSFFGPSKPVIAQRVIQESKSLLENQDLAARILKARKNANKSSSTRPSGSKPGVRPQAPRVSEMKKKVQKIKDTRDYSFLLSEDDERPASPKQPPARSIPPSSDVRSAKFSSQSSRQTRASNSKHVNGSREERRPTSSSGHSNARPSSANGHSNPGPSSANGHNARTSSANGHSNARPGSANGQSNARSGSANGHSNPRSGSVSGHSNSKPHQANGHINPKSGSTNGHSHSRPGSASGHGNPRPGSSNGHSNPRPGSSNGHMNSRVGLANGHGNSRPGPSKLSFDSKPQIAANRKQLASNSSNGPGRPPVSNGLPLKKPFPAPTKSSSQGLKGSNTVGTKPPISKMQSASKGQVQPRRDVRELNRGNVPSKYVAASGRQQIRTQMDKPQKQITSHNRQLEQRPKKRPSRPFPEDDDDDGAAAISMIRKMFGYNPNKFAGRDEDDSDMEANFDDIMREEKRSARIARQEDEEQLRLIEEEERRERMRKKRKIG